MKFYRVLLFVFLVGILAVGAVSADDNATDCGDELLCEDSSDEPLGNFEGDVLSETDEDDNYGELRLESDEVAKGNPLVIVPMGNCNIKGIHVDGVAKKDYTFEHEDEDYIRCLLPTKDLSYGSHSLFVDASNNCSRNFTFIVKNLVVKIPNPVIVNDYWDSYVFVQLPSDGEGKLVVTIDGETTTKTIKKSTSRTFQFDLSKLDVSDKDKLHKIVVKYYNSKNVLVNSTAASVPVNYRISMENGTFIYRRSGENYQEFYFDVPRGFSTDKLSVKVDGVETEYHSSFSSFYYIDPDILDIGNHTVSVSYLGDGKYYADTATATIEIIPEIMVFNGDWYYGSNYTALSLILPQNATGNLSVYCNGSLFVSKHLVNGVCEIPTSVFRPGSYNITAKYSGDDYEVKSKTFSVDVDLSCYLNSRIVSGGKPVLGIFIPKDARANLTISLANQTISGQVIGTGEYFVFNLDAISNVGEYTCHINYAEDGFSFEKTVVVEVIPKLTVLRPNSDDSAMEVTAPGDSGAITIYASNRYDEYVFKANVVNGKAVISLAKLNKGTYSFSFNYKSGKLDCYSYIDDDVKILHSKLEAKDTALYYKSSSGVKVKVTTAKGALVKGKYVKLYVNSKFVKKVKTNKKGTANLKISSAPGKYDIKIQYGKVEITRKVTVKHVLSLKTVKVKKSAKKLTLKATLKEGKKPLKNKKVTFKFNGKSYKAKTDKKGVAKVTVKKAVLKKLKVGKTVKYQAAYIKDVVKKSVKVSK